MRARALPGGLGRSLHPSAPLPEARVTGAVYASMAMRPEFTSVQSEPCILVIYLDGAQLIHEKTDLDVIIHPASVRRIEADFRGVAIPGEFASNPACGVLAIRTGARRRG